MHIRRAVRADAQSVTALALLLWPDHAREPLLEEMTGCITGGESAVFIAEADGKAVAFAQCQLRHEYVEGTGGGPVGYLEGVYVDAPYRRAGVARALLTACEAFGKARGCREFASDCLLNNAQSAAFHLASGFAEANRIICFVKPL